MIDAVTTHLKSLQYTTGKLAEARATPICYDSSVGSKGGCRPLPTSMMKRLLYLVAGFAFTSIEYI